MRKRELKKWHNKYLLWHKLHPRQGFERCKFCKHSVQYFKAGIMACPLNILIDRRGHKHLIEINTGRDSLLPGDIGIEWIKNA